ncbi:ead/Ea22-like family protein [Serratia ureilytica]|uniref:ead/Ea22-like family protein n=1 Tax=Serratia TaxID=613 RepID=UPI00068C440E|nr:ead/Ea22-like family protein [Serratia marcescens]PNO40213.1 hypothetical protein MC48_017165 [Serratia marcescens]
MNNTLSELKAAAMAATPGPWEWFTSNSMARLSSTPSGKDGDVLSAFRASDGVPCVSVSQHNMAFIAAANPAAVIELLAELEAKNKRIAELEAEAKVWESATTKHLERAEEAEKRLATPVRLPDDLEPNTEPCVICGKISSHPEGWHYCNRKNTEGG